MKHIDSYKIFEARDINSLINLSINDDVIKYVLSLFDDTKHLRYKWINYEDKIYFFDKDDNSNLDSFSAEMIENFNPLLVVTHKNMLEHVRNILHDLCSSIERGYILLTPKEISFIDSVFNYENLYNDIYLKSKEIINKFVEYDYNDIEDRLVEFFDDMPKFECKFMFSTYIDNGWMGIHFNENYRKEDEYSKLSGRILRDMFYHMIKRESILPKEYLSKIRPCLNINLNEYTNNNNLYKLDFIENICQRLFNRFKTLFDIKDVLYSFSPGTRKFPNDIDINGYTLTLFW